MNIPPIPPVPNLPEAALNQASDVLSKSVTSAPGGKGQVEGKFAIQQEITKSRMQKVRRRGR
jgi:hypothetical protein